MFWCLGSVLRIKRIGSELRLGMLCRRLESRRYPTWLSLIRLIVIDRFVLSCLCPDLCPSLGLANSGTLVR